MEWKEIPLVDGKYECNELGQVRNNKTKKIKSTYLDKQGYERIGVWLNGKDNSFRVHNLIMNAFYGDKPFPKAEINHIDGNKSNNKLNNLEWCTPTENMKHAVIHELRPSGENNYNAKYKESDIINMYKLYKNGSSLEDIALFFKEETKNIRRIVKGERWKCTYNKYFEEIEGDNILPPQNIKPVIIKNNVEVLEFESQTKCAEYLNVHKSTIGYAIKEKRKIKNYEIFLK